MLVVYLLPQGGVNKSFHMPCRLAGRVPGLDDEINKYLPYCRYKDTKEGSPEWQIFYPFIVCDNFSLLHFSQVDRKCIEIMLVFFYMCRFYLLYDFSLTIVFNA